MANNDEITIIRIKDINAILEDKLIEVISSFENNISTPTWFKLKLENLTENDLWENEYLMRYDAWIDKMNNKKWKIEDIKTTGSSLEIKLKLSGRSNFSELLSILLVLEVDFMSNFWGDLQRLLRFDIKVI